MNSADEELPQPQHAEQKPVGSFKLLKLIIAVAAILLVALVAGTGGYFLGTRNNQSVPSSQLKQSDDVVTQPSPMVMQISPSPYIPASPGSLISTANWQTYTNTKYRYFLKYPREWFIYDRDLHGEEKPISELDKEDYIFITPVKPSIGGGRDPGVIIQADENTTRLTSMEYVQKYMLSKYEMEKNSLRIEPANLQNIDGTIISGFLTGEGPELFIVHGNIGINIHTYFDSHDEATIREMFASIKLIN